MGLLRIISTCLLIFTLLLKFNVIPYNFDSGTVQYLLNGSLLLFSFGVIVPIISLLKFKKMNPQKDVEYLKNILLEIDKESTIDIFLTKSSLVKGAVVLYIKSKPTIIVHHSLINKLSKEQLKFVIAHEYCHVLNNHLIKNVMSLAFALAGVPLLLLIVSPLLFKINVLWIALSIIIVIYVGLIILHFMFSQRREYIADQYATNIVGNEISLSTLKCLKDNYLVSEKSYNMFETHPSLKSRMEKVSEKK
ncbi:MULTISPECIES: M48 family metalloprotease [Bacillus cereus group]|uniref:M48 family metalloprotease n=1 Tax=Bacillus cereus group TaxID=86661 RepID=UPI000F6CB9FF|nr:M48 family metalloprotease [Bacillus cereus]AZJ24731.1 hypothetical protein CT694_35440 [Bacillus wiedmannii bv. thuringiensis]KAB2419691.1 M48 family metalloprotease [Bacillus cereus]MED3357582.1 M48 family metalloprotease [Bacillus thuringiensis]